jgi:multidrug resistance efflux pump
LQRSQYEIALSKAKSDLEKVKQQFDANSAGVESARSKYLAAQANEKKTKQDIHRLEKLYKEDPGAISVRRLESSRASYEHAVAKVAGAKAEIARAIENRGEEGNKNAQLKSAQSEVDKAELDLQHTIVRASTDGIITDLRTDAGQFASAGKPVMTLISINDIWIDAEFTENNLGNMKVGSPAELVIDVLPAQVFSGKVRSIGRGVATSQPPPAGTLPSISNNRDWLRQSQRFPVVIEFDQEQVRQLYGYVRIGGQAEVIVYTQESGFLNILAKVYIRLMSWFSYAY